MRLSHRPLPAFTLLVSLAAPAAFAARSFTPEELLQTRRMDDVQLSPDGKWAAFTVRQKSLAENRDLKDVWVVPTTPGGTARPLTRDTKSEHPRWSPDGRSILVTSARSGDPQLWLFDVAGLSSAPVNTTQLVGGDPHQLTNLWGGADNGIFSPDGRTIAFTSDVYASCNGDDLCNRKTSDDRDASKLKAHVETHLFIRHWTAWRDGKRSHVFALTLPGPQPTTGPAPMPIARDLTPGDSDWPTWRLGGGEDVAFTPDGNELLISHKAAAREAWSTNSDLYSVPVTGGAPKNLTESNVGDDCQPKFSPDGKHLAWLAQERDGYEADQVKLKIQDRRSGKITVSDYDEGFDSFAWRRDSKGLVASAILKGHIYAHAIGLDGKVKAGAQPITADFAVGADGALVYVGSGMNKPPEVYRLSGDRAQRLTSFNQEQYAGLDLGPAPEEMWVEGKDGTKVQSWILKPPGLTEGKKAPLVMFIHGGPQGAWEDMWGMRWNPAVWAARGYVVVMPNVRGSYGYGAKFVESISKDWGGLAYDDVLRATDAAEKLPYVEAGKTCAAGASFGGYMIDWIAGHTDRYQCLVTHDGVFDLRSMYGATEELWFPEFEFGGAYWEQPEAYAKWSPSSYAQNFKTPTLVVHGELDFRVPIDQGLQMFTVLQRRGVESKLLVFPDEGHWVLKPRNSQLWHHTVLDWVDAHLKADAAAKGDAKVEAKK